MLSDLKFRLRALVRRRAMEQELDDELRFHIERETEKYVREGLSRADAERRARLAFGGVERIKDDARDARGIGLADTVTQDLRYAWRGLRAKPGFTGAVVLTLALGIGANTAMFGIIDRLMFRPPAFLVAPERVHRVFTRYIWNDKEQAERSLAYKRFLDFARGTTSFDQVVAVADRTLPIGTGDQAREMSVGAVSANLFQLFDAPPALGRYFTADEDRSPAGAPVAVLGNAFWQTYFGAARDVVGKPIHVGSRIYTIIGVAPDGFVGVTEGAPPAVFVPITAFASSRSNDYNTNYGWSWLDVLVRRKPGMSLARADADLTAAYITSWESERQGSPTYPTATKANARAEAAPILLSRGPDAGPDARVVTWVMGVAVIVLLVACANVANLLLASALKRRREIALRLALGVSRTRLLQQLLTESLLLAVIGGVAGIAVAQWGGRVLRTVFFQRDDAAAVLSDGRTLLFCAVATLGVALLTGLAPAVHAVRSDLADALKSGAREGTYRRSRLRTALLLFQATFSVILLVGAGLFVRSLSNVRGMRMGYDVEPVVYAESRSRSTQPADAEANALALRMEREAATMPGVVAASPTISVPFWSSEGRGAPYVPGRDSLSKLGRFMLQAGSADYFRTLGTRVVRGRGISEGDLATSPPVVVVSQSMADALWPNADAIGQVMRIGRDNQPFMTVVGIAEDIHASRLSGAPEFVYYLPLPQYMARFGSAYGSLFVRVNGRAEDYVEPLRRRLQQLMPGDAYVNTRPLSALVAPRQRSWEFGATMFVAFGVLALTLSAIGLYSVIAYAVAQRSHELGVRIALGASLRNVMGIIVVQGLAFAAAGIVLGSVVAFWAGRWIEPLLFSQKARDPMIYGAVAALLLTVALAATLRPAWRATRVDPTEALRSD